MPCQEGKTQVAFGPVDFMARLVALVPEARINLTRYQEVPVSRAPVNSINYIKTSIGRGSNFVSPATKDAKEECE